MRIGSITTKKIITMKYITTKKFFVPNKKNKNSLKIF